MASKRSLTPRADQVKEAAHRHPWVTWGTIAAVVTVIGVVVPGIYYVANHYQTADDAHQHAMEDLISRSYLQLSIGNNATLFMERSVRNAKIKQKLEPKNFSAYDSLVLEADEKSLDEQKAKMEPIRQLIVDLSKEQVKAKGK